MFSGIVSHKAKLISVQKHAGKTVLRVDGSTINAPLKTGDSVALNGVCLTMTRLEKDGLEFEAVPQTLRDTNLKNLSKNDFVNIETSLCYGDSIGGHMVQGHVDTTAKITGIKEEGDSVVVQIQIPENLKPYIVKKGYIALDGMSVTVQDLSGNYFTIALIPHTQKITIASDYHEGDDVNLEVDMMAKYVETILEKRID